MTKWDNKQRSTLDTLLAYADDLAYVFESVNEAIAFIGDIRYVLLNCGIKINWKKCGIIARSSAVVE